MKNLILIAFSLLFLSSCTSTPKHIGGECVVSKYSAIIRLQDNGRFFCSAFVVSDQYAITAAHCIQSDLGFFMTQKEHVQIANSLGHAVTIAEVVGANSRIDYALIRGDFSSFHKLKMDFSDRAYSTSSYVACGYPQNSKKVKCSRLDRVGTKFFQLKGRGSLLFGGHSGGPVFDGETKLVIGVNSAVDEDGVLIAPVQALPGSFGLEPKDFQ